MDKETNIAQALKPIYAPRVIIGDELGALQRVITGCGLPTTQGPNGAFLNESAARIQGVWMAAVEWACQAAARQLADPSTIVCDPENAGKPLALGDYGYIARLPIDDSEGGPHG